MYSFILNPNAGSGRAAKVRPLIERFMAGAGVDFQIVETSRPAEGTEAARAAAATSRAVVSVGGDGSLHHVAAGLIEARLVGASAVLGILPIGTGNDFARMVGMPAEPELALAALLEASPMAADHGWAIWEIDGVAIRRPFINCAGAGLDAKSALLATRLKPFVGNSSYVISAAITVLGWRAPDARVTVERSGDEHDDFWEGRLTLASVANGKWIGGGIYVSPDASISDRLLDLCLIARVSIPRAFWLLSKAVNGTHVGKPGVTVSQLERVTVTTVQPVPVYVDGEPGAPAVTKVVFEVAGGELPILAPKQTGRNIIGPLR